MEPSDELVKKLKQLNFVRRSITGDGNCFFRAVSYVLYGNEEQHLELRTASAHYFWTHRGYFLSFTEGETDFCKIYETILKINEPADNLAIQSLALTKNLTINILNANLSTTTIKRDPTLTPPSSVSRTVNLLYRGNLIDGHYDSLDIVDKNSKKTTDKADRKKTKCSVSQVNLETKMYLHSEESMEKEALQCSICDKRFKRKDMLNRHFLSHTGVKAFRCSVCKKRFTRKDQLKRHTILHTGAKDFKCNLCEQRFGRKDHLDIHMRSHTNKKPFQCIECKKSFNRKSHLDSHMTVHTENRPFKCTVCDYTFKRQDHLKTHMLTHCKEKKYQCSECGNTFTQKSSLNLHYRIHEGQTQFKCNVCKKSFGRKHHLINHLLLHAKIKAFKCDVCKKTFRRKDDLDIHYLSHNQEKFFKCTECNKSFIENSHLDTHICVHSENTPSRHSNSDYTFNPDKDIDTISSSEESIDEDDDFKCDVCKKTFRRKDDLDIHYLSHNQEKFFKCTECNKSFIENSHLDTHICVHSENTPSSHSNSDYTFNPDKDIDTISSSEESIDEDDYRCSVCKKWFTRKNNLHRHMILHTRVKDYKCRICKKLFARKDALDSHMNSHTKDKLFECFICKKSFTRKSNLDSHMLTHTENELSSQIKSVYIYNPDEDVNTISSSEESMDEDDDFKCDVCKKTFRRKDDLDIHYLSHNQEKFFQCTDCNKLFKQKSHLESHMWVHKENNLSSHSNSDDTYNPDEDIDIISSSEESIDEDDFKCDVCKKTFRRKDNLNRHMLIHTKVKDYKCRICKQSFAQKDQLTRHTISHARVKPFGCIICDKNFGQKHLLKRHMLLHRRNKNFKPRLPRSLKCSKCGERFAKRLSLEMHICSGDKIFKCPVCGKQFGLRSEWKKHTTLGHKYACYFCNKMYIQYHNLERHITKHTKEKIIQDPLPPYPLHDELLIFRFTQDKVFKVKRINMLTRISKPYLMYYTPWGYIDDRDMQKVAVGFTTNRDVIEASTRIFDKIKRGDDNACSYSNEFDEKEWTPCNEASLPFGIYATTVYVASTLKWYMRLRLDSIGTLKKHSSIKKLHQHAHLIEDVLLQYKYNFPPRVQRWMKFSETEMILFINDINHPFPGINENLILQFNNLENIRIN